jgi:hydrogenase expression/formation protein HypC
MRIVTRDGAIATCEGRGRRERVDLSLVDDPPVGTWILAYQGTAVRWMTDVEAAETSAALDALEAVLAGEADVDRYFADLVGRTPSLPPHLAGTDR